jgi:hypothetical protein
MADVERHERERHRQREHDWIHRRTTSPRSMAGENVPDYRPEPQILITITADVPGEPRHAEVTGVMITT